MKCQSSCATHFDGCTKVITSLPSFPIANIPSVALSPSPQLLPPSPPLLDPVRPPRKTAPTSTLQELPPPRGRRASLDNWPTEFRSSHTVKRNIVRGISEPAM